MFDRMKAEWISHKICMSAALLSAAAFASRLNVKWLQRVLKISLHEMPLEGIGGQVTTSRLAVTEDSSCISFVSIKGGHTNQVDDARAVRKVISHRIKASTGYWGPLVVAYAATRVMTAATRCWMKEIEEYVQE